MTEFALRRPVLAMLICLMLTVGCGGQGSPKSTFSIHFIGKVPLVVDSGDLEVVPHDVVLDQSGRLWVADIANRGVFVFEHKSGCWLMMRQVTKTGQGPGDVGLPTCLAVTGQGEIVVGDRPNRRIHFFNSDCMFLRSIPCMWDMVRLSAHGDKIYVSANALEQGEPYVHILSVAGKILGTRFPAVPLRNDLETGWSVPIIDFDLGGTMYSTRMTPILPVVRTTHSKELSFPQTWREAIPEPQMVVKHGERKVNFLMAVCDLKVVADRWVFVLERGGTPDLAEQFGWRHNILAVYSVEGRLVGHFALAQAFTSNGRILPIPGTSRFYVVFPDESAMFEYEFRFDGREGEETGKGINTKAQRHKGQKES